MRQQQRFLHVFWPFLTFSLSSTGLTPGQSYEVVAAAQMISDPDLIGFASALISVAYSGVQATIGNVPSSASAAQVFELDATGSVDRDDATQTLVFRWTWQLCKSSHLSRNVSLCREIWGRFSTLSLL